MADPPRELSPQAQHQIRFTRLLLGCAAGLQFSIIFFQIISLFAAGWFLREYKHENGNTSARYIGLWISYRLDDTLQHYNREFEYIVGPVNLSFGRRLQLSLFGDEDTERLLLRWFVLVATLFSSTFLLVVLALPHRVWVATCGAIVAGFTVLVELILLALVAQIVTSRPQKYHGRMEESFKISWCVPLHGCCAILTVVTTVLCAVTSKMFPPPNSFATPRTDPLSRRSGNYETALELTRKNYILMRS